MNRTPQMDEVLPDTPAFESTAAVAREGTDGSEVLQLGPADAATQPTMTDEAFAMHLGDTRPKPVDKPSKPVTAAANASLIAALMGQPIAKTKPGKPSATDATADLQDAAAASFSRYSEKRLGRGSAESPATPISPAAPESVATPTPATPPAVVILTEHDPLPAPTPPPQVPQTAVAAIRHAAASPPAESPKPVVAATVSASPAKAVLSGVRVGTTPASPGGGNPDQRATAKSPLFQKPVASTPKAVAATPPPFQPSVQAPRRAIPVAPVWPGSERAASEQTARVHTRGHETAAKAEPREAAPIEFPKPAPMPTGAWWTIPLTFVGIAITACAVIVPAADENRRDTYELAKIERDVDYFQRQSAVNTDFLRRIDTDPTLAERLALRQLHRTREGAKVVALGGLKPDRFAASPYAITRLDPPADLPPYRPVPGKLTEWFLGDKRPQQMAGLGLCVAGAGVLLGGLRKRRRPASPLDA